MAAPGGGGKDGGGGGAAPPGRSSSSSMTKAELVRRWEEVFDGVGDDDRATELFMTLLLRDARADYAAQQQARRNDDDEEERQRRRARVFQPWQPSSLPGGSASSARPPAPARAVVLGLRAAPHLLLPAAPRDNVVDDGTTTTPSADLGRSVRPEKN